jgi:hypothetical protein
MFATLKCFPFGLYVLQYTSTRINISGIVQRYFANDLPSIAKHDDAGWAKLVKAATVGLLPTNPMEQGAVSRSAI